MNGQVKPPISLVAMPFMTRREGDASPDSAHRADLTRGLTCTCARTEERAIPAVRASGNNLADVAFAATGGNFKPRSLARPLHPPAL
jgi:hypothetical protein